MRFPKNANNHAVREVLIQKLQELDFYQYAKKNDASKWGKKWSKEGGVLWDLLAGTDRMISVGYKEEPLTPWMTDFFLQATHIFSKLNLNFTPKAKKSDPKAIRIKENVSSEKYELSLGDKNWIIWENEANEETQSLLERNAVIRICNEMLMQNNSIERIWCSAGEKGGESLFIFLTDEQQRLINDSLTTFDKITPNVTEI